MSLLTREKDFENLLKNKNAISASSLIASLKINKNLRQKFDQSVIKYLSKSCGQKYSLKTEKEIINYYDKKQFELDFITPNGAIVPKKETSKEFNQIVKYFVLIIKSFGLEKSIESFHIPINIRIKFKKIPKEYYSRDRATETPHSDSWAGENSECVNMHIPIFGDYKSNKMEFYHPFEFKESWLRPLKNFSQGEKYLKYYKKVKFTPLVGHINISDFSTLHRTTRKKNCGTRISLDTTFVLKRGKSKNKKSVLHADRSKEYVKIPKFLKLGTDLRFEFRDSLYKKFVENKKAFKHFANYTLK